MTNREKIIGIVMLAIIAIWSIMYWQKRHREKVKVKPIALPEVRPIPVLGKQLNESWQERDLEKMVEKIKLRSKSLELSSIRDPFKKLKPQIAGVDFSNLVLSGIMWEEEEPLALINERVVKEGEKIADFLIEEIREDEVVLIKGMDRYILKLSPTLKKE